VIGTRTREAVELTVFYVLNMSCLDLCMLRTRSRLTAWVVSLCQIVGQKSLKNLLCVQHYYEQWRAGTTCNEVANVQCSALVDAAMLSPRPSLHFAPSLASSNRASPDNNKRFALRPSRAAFAAVTEVVQQQLVARPAVRRSRER